MEETTYPVYIALVHKELVVKRNFVFLRTQQCLATWTSLVIRTKRLRPAQLSTKNASILSIVGSCVTMEPV